MNAAKEVCVDASLAVKVVVPEPDSDKADALLNEWANNATLLIAPSFFDVETDNPMVRKLRPQNNFGMKHPEALLW